MVLARLLWIISTQLLYNKVSTLTRTTMQFLGGVLFGQSIPKAIEESQIAVIIIFSKNYVDSWWCLNELEYIIKCNGTREQIVMPILYDLDPSRAKQKQNKK